MRSDRVFPSAWGLTTDRQRGARSDPKNDFRGQLWSAPEIHGELPKLGIDVAQSTVSIYMVPRQGPPLQVMLWLGSVFLIPLKPGHPPI
jgi:hypothetical protein